MVAGRHHGDVLGRAREDPDAPQGTPVTAHSPRRVWSGRWVRSLSRSFSRKLLFPPHPPCFPHPQTLTLRPQEPAAAKELAAGSGKTSSSAPREEIQAGTRKTAWKAGQLSFWLESLASPRPPPSRPPPDSPRLQPGLYT